MAEDTIDDLARALDAANLDAEAWRRWMASDTADAALVRDVLAATDALMRGDLDHAGYHARMTALWTYWRERLDTLPPDEES